MRLFIAALLMILGTQAWAECGNLCNEDWWKTATTSDVKAELNAGADAKAKDQNGKTTWDLAQDNDKLKDTKSYWALNDAQYN